MADSKIIPIEMPPASGYGAAELKQYMRRYTLRGFLAALIIIALVLAIFYIFGKAQDSKNEAPMLAPVAKMTLEDLPPPPTDELESAPPPPQEIQQIVNTGPAARAGTPIAVPDAEITPDMQDFAAMDELSRASAEGGTGEDFGGFAPNIDFEGTGKVEIKQRVEEPAPDEFVPVEKEPNVDLAQLQKLVKYPELARKAGVEGQVIVKVLIGKQGEVRKTLVEYSDNELLNQSAIDAVKNYTGFTPGIQNGNPVMVWVSIPIRFQLR